MPWWPSLAIVALIIVGCARATPAPCRPETPHAASTTPRRCEDATSYTPLFPAGIDLDSGPDISDIERDSKWAAKARTTCEAIARWNKFLELHAEYEDGFAHNYVQAARVELLRIYYALGNAEAGDRFLREMLTD